MTKDQILAALPSLSNDDLATIKLMIADLQGKKAPAETLQGPQGWLIEALSLVCNRHIAGITKGQARTFIAFIEHYWPDTLSKKVEFMLLSRYFLQLLAQQLEDMRVPITPTTMVHNFGRMEEVFNDNFPGYGARGAANILNSVLLNG